MRAPLRLATHRIRRRELIHQGSRDFNIESFYCRPGIEGAHEKGGVEGTIGCFRRNHSRHSRKSTRSPS
ncbi:hypothetical protein [Streptomyces sp. NPDC014744]|uniref:hypothetical protein n=1 Tax=Streptomyces sp. NPDC014744 TaxID=3364903 RepID=UPI0036F64348